MMSDGDSCHVPYDYLPLGEDEDCRIESPLLSDDGLSSNPIDDPFFLAENSTYVTDVEVELPVYEDYGTEYGETEGYGKGCYSSAEVSPKIEGRGTFDLSTPGMRVQMISNSDGFIYRSRSHNVSTKNKWTVDNIDQILDAQNMKIKKKDSKRNSFTKKQKEVLDTWFRTNVQHPYPNNSVIKELSTKTNLSPKQIRTYYVNKRIRHWAKDNEEQKPNASHPLPVPINL